MNTDEAIKKVILYLALPENEGKEFDFNKTLQQLEIPREMHKSIYSKLLYAHHFIHGPVALKDPVIHITDKGKAYAEALKESYFQTHGEPLQPLNTYQMSFDHTCELLFQMHKDNGFEITWTKNTYNNQPENLNTAREMMLRQGILFSKNLSGKAVVTLLNPDFLNILTYKEALDVINEKRGVQNIITTHNYGNNVPVTIAAGYKVEQKDISITITNNDYQELERLGVESAAIDELKLLVHQNGKDKATMKEKLLKWFGQVSASVATKGLAENIPAIFEYVQKLTLM